MKDVDLEAEVEELYEKLFLILDENGKSILRKIRLKCMEKVKHLHGELEDNKKIIEIYKEDITEYEKVADTLDKELAEMVEEAIHLKNLKVGIKERLNRQRKEFKVLKSQKDGKSRAKGIIEKKRDELIITIENVHEICAYSRHTNIDNLRREIKQTVDEYIEYCEKCDEPKYGCNCESN